MKTLVAVTLLAVAASACGGPWSATPAEREARTTRRIEALLTDVDATPAQRAQILGVTSGVRDRHHGDREATKATRAVFVEQWSADAPDAAVVRLAVEEGVALKLAHAHALVDAGVEIHQTLTPAQRTKLEDQLPLGRARFAMGLVQRAGYGPPATKEELAERAEVRFTEALDELKATDAQRAALRPLLAAVLDDVAPLTATPGTLKDALVSAWQSDKADAVALHALIDLEGDKAAVAAQSAASALIKAHAILTVEQRAQLATRLQNGGGCHHGHHGDTDDDDVAPRLVPKKT